MNILDEIGQRVVFFDGGTGSLLQEKGLLPGELPEVWNITHPDLIIQLHEQYLAAGCDIIKTNTFGANRLKFNETSEYSLTEIVAAAISHAKQAVAAQARKSGRTGMVALDLGPTGKLLKPFGDLSFEDACELYQEIVKIGVREGVDLILIETMSDGYEAKAAVLAAKEHSSLPVFVTVTFDERGKLLTGGSIRSAVALLEGLGVDALGINCGLGPVQMKKLAAEMISYASVPVIVNPNAGLPRSENGRTVYDIDAAEFSHHMQEIVQMGALVVGGCCGTTPLHISKTTARCKDLKVSPPTPKEATVVTSYTHAVEIGADPVLIGERINPTGKPRFKQALKDHDLNYILQVGVSQQDHGAHILDVNVGLPEIDEADMMEEVVKELQSIIDLPLQIDTSDLQAMERGLRCYNGKAMINSVNGKRESMEAVFPLVKKYGGVVVALTLDEQGIPETAAGRVEIAKKIYETAQQYGIHKKDIIIDALCLTISADTGSANVSLEALRRIRDELGGKTILGVSNISFGLPDRETINAFFFTMALQQGLSAAIINPNAKAMMNAYFSFRALADLDSQCQDYIGNFTGEKQEQNVKKEDGKTRPLSECIFKGLKELAGQAAKVSLETMEALDIIQQQMIPALDEVGKKFEQGTMFLPQLLMSAEAAQAAFEVLRTHMAAQGQVQQKKGMIILATVKGDIHDIGKNIVKVLLENYGYDVIDLGKDVDPDVIVDRTVKDKVMLVGLSALMTTTVPSMELTIKKLRTAAPWAKVMVGGAVLTAEYAKTIDADRYCKDAMASVNYAQETIG